MDKEEIEWYFMTNEKLVTKIMKNVIFSNMNATRDYPTK